MMFDLHARSLAGLHAAHNLLSLVQQIAGVSSCSALYAVIAGLCEGTVSARISTGRAAPSHAS
jgi:hypothetical protein